MAEKKTNGTAKTPAVRISCMQPGFRRGGMAHEAGPKDHPADTFTAEQLEALKREPKLLVEEIPAAAQNRAAAQKADD